jgi:hypothetical protein
VTNRTRHDEAALFRPARDNGTWGHGGGIEEWWSRTRRFDWCSTPVMSTSERVENENDRVWSRMSTPSMTLRDISRQKKKKIPANGGKGKQWSRRLDSSIAEWMRAVSSAFGNTKVSPDRVSRRECSARVQHRRRRRGDVQRATFINTLRKQNGAHREACLRIQQLHQREPNLSRSGGKAQPLRRLRTSRGPQSRLYGRPAILPPPAACARPSG